MTPSPKGRKKPTELDEAIKHVEQWNEIGNAKAFNWLLRVLKAARRDRDLIAFLDSTDHSSIELCPQMSGGIWVWQGAHLDGKSDDYKGRWFKGGLREFHRSAIRQSREK